VPLGIARGLKIESDLHGPAYLWLGLYEYEIQAWLRRLAPKDAIVYDVGAASGVLALAFARLTGAVVCCFEPDAGARAALAAHVRHNAWLAELIEVVDQPVGSPGGDGLTLDGFAEGRTSPTLLKIDVEGAELDVLVGSAALLRGRRPHILLETHSAELEHACAELLVRAGYAPRIISQRRRLREDRPSSHNRWLVAQGDPPLRD
jgi:hypothetical protein